MSRTEPTRIARTAAILRARPGQLGATALLGAAVLGGALAPTAGAALPSASGAWGGATGAAQPQPTMSVGCTAIALKFTYGAYLMNKPGATTIDEANGKNLQSAALDAWYREGCDSRYGLMPVW